LFRELYYKGLIGIYAEKAQILTGTQLTLLFVCGVLGAIIAGYFLGSINTALIVSKYFFKDDIRNHGSSNAGATNIFRTYGVKAAILTIAGDLLKTILAIIIARFIGLPGVIFGSKGVIVSLPGYLAGLFAIMGHSFPVYYKFKGGKGVVCLAALMMVLSPLVFLVCILIFIGLVASTKYVSLGSVISTMLYPIILSRFEGFSIAVNIALFMAVVIVFNHRSNIKRLLEGTESKFEFKKMK